MYTCANFTPEPTSNILLIEPTLIMDSNNNCCCHILSFYAYLYEYYLWYRSSASFCYMYTTTTVPSSGIISVESSIIGKSSEYFICSRIARITLSMWCAHIYIHTRGTPP